MGISLGDKELAERVKELGHSFATANTQAPSAESFEEGYKAPEFKVVDGHLVGGDPLAEERLSIMQKTTVYDKSYYVEHKTLDENGKLIEASSIEHLEPGKTFFESIDERVTPDESVFVAHYSSVADPEPV